MTIVELREIMDTPHFNVSLLINTLLGIGAMILFCSQGWYTTYPTIKGVLAALVLNYLWLLFVDPYEPVWFYLGQVSWAIMGINFFTFITYWFLKRRPSGY